MRFNFALSFSSHQRLLAKQITEALINDGQKVFFDENFEHELLGKDGVEYFNNVFFKESQFCIVLLSIDYEKSAWTRLEKRAVQAREFSEDPGYLIPVLVDRFKPDWLLPTKIFFDLSSRPIDRLIEILSLKIKETGNGQFKIKKEIRLDEEVESICRATCENESYNLSFRHDEGHVNGAWSTRIKRNINDWETENHFCRFVGGYVLENEKFIVGVPNYARDRVIWLFNKFTNTDKYYRIPIQGDYDNVTDCILINNKLIISIEHGESYIFNVLDGTFHCFKNQIPWKEEYNGIDIPSTVDIYNENKIILGVDKLVSFYTLNGEFETQFEFSEVIHSVTSIKGSNTILIASRDYLYNYDISANKQKFKHQLASAFPKTITCIKNLIAICSGFAGITSCIELLNASTGNSYFILRSMFLENIYYDATISDDGNSLLFLNTRYEMQDGKRIDQRFLTIMSKP